MTRAVVFLAATLVAASLGVVAQGNPVHQDSTPAVQSNANPPPAAQNQAGSTASAAGANDSVRQTTTADGASNVKDAHGQETAANNLNGQLPQTSTILPLLGLIGLGSLIAGFFARK